MAADQHFFVFFTLMITFLLIFLIGFFPLKNSLEPTLTHQSYVRKNDSLVKKVVLIIIDGVREDFINPRKSLELRLPYLQSSILKNESCFIPLRATAPTVTLPRIKAITSGSVPVYLDVVLNLGSEEFHEDTFLRQAFFHGLKMVFYGDDTWIKMFPSLFTRKGGTHSFFAADFWEVDQNVTDQIRNELVKDDWDILIAHYLGLDHIGHMEGPQSRHITRKLAEMDNIIEEVTRSTKNPESLLVLVTGDHGMKDSGGHGGVTYPEIIVPLVTVGRPCAHLPGWPTIDEHIPNQIDLAATISFALGLPTPLGNLGKLIPHILHGAPHVDVVNKLSELKIDLMKKVGDRSANYQTVEGVVAAKTTQDDIRKLASTYYSDLRNLSTRLTRESSGFNLFFLIISNILLILLLIASVIFSSIPIPRNPVQCFLLFGMLGHTISLGSSSFIEEEHQTWYFFWATFLLLACRETWKIYNSDQSSLLLLWWTYWPLMLIAVLHRLLREMNRTGDKWAHLPDLEDFLRSHNGLLLLVFVTGLVWWYYLFTLENKRRLDRLIFLSALLSIATYRLSIGSFDVIGLKSYPQSRGKLEVTIFLGTFSIFCYLRIRSRKSISWAWSLLYGITLRPHNALLLPTHIFISKQLYKIFKRDEDHFWNTLAHIWCGQMFYFYQGNSNSLANIDVAPAFIASDEYEPIYATVLTTIHTFSGPIQAILLSPMSYRAILFSRLLPSSIYCLLVTFLRHHLFVWSVFSPKLLIDSALSLVLWLLLGIHTVMKIYGVSE